MCLVGLRLGTHPGCSVLLVANRDEFHARPTAPADGWPDEVDVIGGRDLQAGGTWLGATRTGRWAAITNFRAPGAGREMRASRGGLVSAYLRGTASPNVHASTVLAQAHDYDAFNLLLGDRGEVFYVSSMLGTARRLEPGDHVLSNHHLGTPWPKTRRLLEALRSAPPEADDEHFFAMLADRTPAPDDELPDTGVGLPLERVLAPAFIVTPSYGTRASSVLRIDETSVQLAERSFAPDGVACGTRRLRLE